MPVGLMRDGKGVSISVMSINLAGVVITMCALVGIRDFLPVQLPTGLLAGSW